MMSYYAPINHNRDRQPIHVNTKSCTTFSGPFVKVTSILLNDKTCTVTVRIPLSSLCVFMTAEDALKCFGKKPSDISSTINKEEEFVHMMQKKIELARKNFPLVKNIWFAEISPYFKYWNNIVLICPTQNEIVDQWMKGGPMAQLADAIRFSPLLGGDIELNIAKEHFKESKNNGK